MGFDAFLAAALALVAGGTWPLSPLAAGAGFVVAALFDWNWVRPPIERYISQKTQREFRMDDLHVRLGLTPTIRMRGVYFWTVLIFLLEASVFLLIGSSLRGVIERVGGFDVVLYQMAGPILLILLALTLARFVWVFGSDAVIRLLRALGWKRYTPVCARAALIRSTYFLVSRNFSGSSGATGAAISS